MVANFMEIDMRMETLECKSVYVVMRDGIRLAVSTWLTKTDLEPIEGYPAVLLTTRYWRAMSFRSDDPELQLYFPWAAALANKGYRLVVVDARGTGASFGCREGEVDCAEVEDIGELISWCSQQTWCDGRVSTYGVSYSAITALYSLVNAPKALKKSVCRAPDFDMYRHLFAPGGIINHWFIESWGASTAAQDANNLEALLTAGGWSMLEDSAHNILGVRPVDEDMAGSLLAAAVKEHSANFNIAAQNSSVTYIDHFLSEKNPPVYDSAYKHAIEKNAIPLVVRCGWHDGGTAMGALSLFATIDSPMQIVIGPWNHDGTYHVDPFQKGDGSTPLATPIAEARALVINSLDQVFYPERSKLSLDNGSTTAEMPKRFVEYYTLGENRWKTTEQWPLPQAEMQRLYLGENHQLTIEPPLSEKGSDHYQADPTSTTGRFNRWHAQASNQPVHFPDRGEEDKKLLVYDTPPLEKDTEITGHPVVHLFMCSTATDGQFFVYLETIDPDGRVRLLSDGQLRGIHRKVSGETEPYSMFGPYHSLLERDAMPIVPGEVTEITFDLYPMSVMLNKGQRIRVAIAGADVDTFTLIEGCENPTIKVERNSVYASHLELPIVQLGQKQGNEIINENI